MKLKLFFLLFAIPFVGFSQMPYSLNKTTDITIGSSILAGGIGFTLLNSDVTPLTETEILALNSNNINAFDRNTTKNYSKTIAKTSDYFAAGTFIAAVGIQGLITLKQSTDKSSFWDHASTLGVIAIETNLISVLGTNIIKSSVTRTRPYVYNSSVDINDKLDIHARKSFFSGHTAFTATNSFLAAHVISQYYPKSWMSYTGWTVAAAIPTAVAIMRVKAGKHFPTDVMAGYAFGALCGILIPQIHKSSNDEATVAVSPVGLKFSYVF